MPSDADEDACRSLKRRPRRVAASFRVIRAYFRKSPTSRLRQPRVWVAVTPRRRRSSPPPPFRTPPSLPPGEHHPPTRRERDASACMRRHQASALAPVPTHSHHAYHASTRVHAYHASSVASHASVPARGRVARALAVLLGLVLLLAGVPPHAAVAPGAVDTSASKTPGSGHRLLRLLRLLRLGRKVKQGEAVSGNTTTRRRGGRT